MRQMGRNHKLYHILYLDFGLFFRQLQKIGNFGHMDLTIDHQSLCFRLVEHLLLYQNIATSSPGLLGCPPLVW